MIFNTLEHPILNENRTASRACKVRGLQKTASSKSPTKEVTTVDKFKFVSIMRHRSSLKIQSLFFSLINISKVGLDNRVVPNLIKLYFIFLTGCDLN